MCDGKNELSQRPRRVLHMCHSEGLRSMSWASHRRLDCQRDPDGGSVVSSKRNRKKIQKSHVTQPQGLSLSWDARNTMNQQLGYQVENQSNATIARDM